jgi:ParB family chromosome partitioning protein
MKIENTTRGEIFWMNADDKRLVVVTDKQHRLYDSRVELPVDPAMVASISDPKIGILEPVIVRNVGGTYEVVEGRQRVKAARAAQEQVKGRVIRVPLIVRSSCNDASAASMSAIANNQRTEETATQKGERVKVLLETGHSKDEVCSIFGVGWQTISGWVAIAESPETSAALEAGTVTATEAAKIAKSKNPVAKLQEPKVKPEGRVRIVIERKSGQYSVKISSDVTDTEGFFEALIAKLQDHP